MRQESPITRMSVEAEETVHLEMRWSHGLGKRSQKVGDGPVAHLEGPRIAECSACLLKKRTNAGSIRHLHDGAPTHFQRPMSFLETAANIISGKMLEHTVGKDQIEKPFRKRQVTSLSDDEPCSDP
jgi:hypothetical protein